MENFNPISLQDSDLFPLLVLPKECTRRTLIITIKIWIESPGWIMEISHSLELGGKSISVDANVAALKLEIGLISELNNQKVNLISRVTKTKDGREEKNEKANYTLIFSDENGTLIALYHKKSDAQNPDIFYTKFTVMLEK